MKKLVSILFYLLIGFIFPLISSLHLLFNYKVLLILAACIVLLMTQPEIDPADERSNRTKDKLSFWLILFGALFTIVLPLFEWSNKIDNMSEIAFVSYGGVIIILSGLILRYMSIRILGKFFTSTVMIQESHELIQKGPYKHLRHPSYTGALLCFIGFSILLEAWISLPFVLLIMGLIYRYRITAEEHTLRNYFGEQYERYQRFTWRLIPGIW